MTRYIFFIIVLALFFGNFNLENLSVIESNQGIVFAGDIQVTGANESKSLTNPLHSTSFTGPDGLLIKIIDVILIFALPIIIFFIMYAGFMYVTAAGETAKIQTAHSALTWAVIGGVIVLGAKLIMAVIQNTIKAF